MYPSMLCYDKWMLRKKYCILLLRRSKMWYTVNVMKWELRRICLIFCLFVYLFVCLIHTSSRFHVRACEEYLKWFFTSSVHDKNKKMMIVQSSNRRRRFFWSFFASNRRRRFFTQWLSFVIVSHSSWSFRFWFVFALSRSYHRMTRADFKTIESFCRKISKWSSLFVEWSSNDHVLSDSTFWILSYCWDFYFVLNSCTRKWHSAIIESIIRDVMMISRWEWSTNDVTFVILFLRAKMLLYSSTS
jgi:hypothetical protein